MQDDEVIGEHPALDHIARIEIRFRAATTCKHGMLSVTCKHCKRENWLDCLVRKKDELDPTEPQRTVRDIVKQLIEEGVISWIEVVDVLEPYVKGEQRRERVRRYKTFAKIGGLIAASGLLVFAGTKGTKVGLRLWAERKQKEES